MPAIRSVGCTLGLYFTKTLRPVVGALRDRGVRMIQYIDDILIMSRSENQTLEHTAAYLLENLGFIVHPDKSELRPTQDVEFLGMVVNTVNMTLQKDPKRSTESAKKGKVTARMVSRIIGKMSAMTQAIPPAPLFFRSLQRDLARGLEKGDQCYEAPCHLSQNSRKELEWWITHLERWNGKNIVVDQPNFVIESDASLKGWGAAHAESKTGGSWSKEEKQYHINCLEIMAVHLAVMTFLKDHANVTVLRVAAHSNAHCL